MKGIKVIRITSDLLRELTLVIHLFEKYIDCEQSLFCSKIRAGRTAKPRARNSSGERRIREPRVAWAGE